MENPDGSKIELLIILGSIAIGFGLTYYTKTQRDIARKQKKERKQMASDLAELKQRLK